MYLNMRRNICPISKYTPYVQKDKMVRKFFPLKYLFFTITEEKILSGLIYKKGWIDNQLPAAGIQKWCCWLVYTNLRNYFESTVRSLYINNEVKIIAGCTLFRR